MRFGCLGICIVLSALAAAPAEARPTETERLMEYADMLGRAAACGVDVTWPTELVAGWIDDTFTPGTAEHSAQLAAFVRRMLVDAGHQEDMGAERCVDVALAVQSFPWPGPGL